ncbi:MAG: alpha/beta fold hydrolase [Acetobacteraceae bacterium]
MMNWVEVNGTSLRYELSGGGKTTLVLVHEMGGTLDSWDQVLPAVNHARQVLRYDTRGAGLSEKILGAVTFDDMADDLAALLDAVGITGKIALAGTAVGGAIAMHFAVRHASRAGALVVTSPATGVTPDRRQATLDRAAAAESQGMRGLVEASVANSYPPVVRHNAEDFRKFRARWLANDPHSFAAINRMLIDSVVTAELPRIGCPTLVIGCTHDALRPPAQVEPMARQIPGAEYMEINSGHFAGIQTPGLVSQAFHGFLASHGY